MQESSKTMTSVPSSVVGMDLSDRTSQICRIDSNGQVVERRKLKNTESDLTSYFSRLKANRVVLEAGTHSPWISRLIAKCGQEVVVANPRSLGLISKSRKKTDKEDAETLARVGRTDIELLHPICHRGVEAQRDLAAIRARASLIDARTQLINHVRGAVKSFGARLSSCDADYFHRYAAFEIPKELRPALVPVLNLIRSLSKQISSLNKRIESLCRESYLETKLLRQVPGVGALTSLCFVLVIDDPKRFQRSREVAPFLGLTPRLRQSGESQPQLGITKAGDKMLRGLLVQAAHYILGPHGPDSDLKRWGLKLQEGGSRAGTKKRAVVAVARKLSVLLHRLWVTGEVYEPLNKSKEAPQAA